MSDQQVPTAPNYSPFIDAYNNLNTYAQQQGNNALNYAQGQVASNGNLTNDVVNGVIGAGNSLYNAGSTALGQGQDLVTQGIQNLKDQYAKYTDPARKASDMGAAGAGAAQADDAARQASQSELESYGINPGDVRYGGLDQSARLQSAGNRVGAENIAGRTDDALADQTNQEILGQGNTSNTTGTGQTTAGGSLATGAVNTALANTASGEAGLGTGLSWTQPQSTALAGATGATNTGFQNQATSDQIANSSSSGLGSLAGLGLSALGKGGALASGGALAFLADGGIVPEGGVLPTAPTPNTVSNSPVTPGGQGPSTMAPQPNVINNNQPVLPVGANSGNFAGPGQGFSGDMSYFDGGGAVPVAASPSRGAVTDDVPAQGPSGRIQLNGGEFVIPKDVVSWEGEKSLQNLIQKARTAKLEATAKPKVVAPGGPQPQQPAFQPRPQAAQQGALPV